MRHVSFNRLAVAFVVLVILSWWLAAHAQQPAAVEPPSVVTDKPPSQKLPTGGLVPTSPAPIERAPSAAASSVSGPNAPVSQEAPGTSNTIGNTGSSVPITAQPNNDDPDRALTLRVPEATPVNGPPIVASLVQIKADWSQLPASKEIEAELRSALTGEEVPDELIKGLPLTGPAILFPPETASWYSQKHFSEFLAWLQLRQIILGTEIIPSESLEMRREGSEESYKIDRAILTKNVEVFGLNPSSASGIQSFIARTAELTWVVHNRKQHLSVQLNMTSREKARGEENPKVESLLSSSYTTAMLEGGQVIVVPAFPSRDDVTLQYAAKAKGFELLLVIEQRSAGQVPAVQPRLVLPDRIERLKVARTHVGTSELAQLFGRTPSFSPSVASASRMVISENIIVTWSEGNDVAWGFSKSLGKWAKQELNPPPAAVPKDSRPILDRNMAVWQVGSTYYAFSGDSGSWDVLRLPDDHKPPPVLDSGVARLHDGDDVYTFASSTGRWSSPQNASGTEPAVLDKTGEPQFKMFPLRYARAPIVEQTIRQVLRGRIKSLAADERTNSLIVLAEPQLLKEAEALIVALDQEVQAATSPVPSSRAAHPSAPIWQPPKGPSPAELMRLTREQLQALYDEKEQQTRQLAEEIRGVQAAGKPDQQRLEKLKSSLRGAVAESFAAGQCLRHKENAAIQERAYRIAQSLENRFKVADQIIDYHVKDLLNPDLQWESVATPAVGATSSDTFSERAQLFVRLSDDRKWIENANDDITKAPTAEQRRKAREVKLSWLRDIMIVLLRLSKSGEKNDAELAAIEAEIRQAEVELNKDYEERAKLTSPPATQSESDSTSARAVRDKLRERWAQIESLYFNGRFPISELLQAAKELGEAEIRAASTPAERLAARRQHLERLQGVKSVVDAKFSAGVEPENQKLAVDADVLKAEAALAAESINNQSRLAPSVAIPSDPKNQLSAEEAKSIWNVLGVKVRAASAEELGDSSRYAGGAVITEIRPGGPADGMAPLRVNDIIVMVDRWEVTSLQRLVVILTQPFTHWSRGGEKLLGTVVVLRGKGDRRGIVQNSMEFSPESVMPPATSTQETTVTQSTSPGGAAFSGSRPTTQIRSADEFRRQLRDSEDLVQKGNAALSSPITGKDQEEKTRKLQQLRDLRDRNERDLAFLREEYAAQMRLLELELKDARDNLDAALKHNSEIQAIIKTNPQAVSRAQMTESANRVQSAESRAERAKTLLDLYRKADPKSTETETTTRPT